MVFGYCRISKPKQNIERQERNILSSFPNAKIYREVYTGVVLNRQEWQKLIKKVRKGDTIVFDSVSRMSRNASEGVEQYMELLDRGIELVFLREPYVNTINYKQALSGGVELVGNDIADVYIEATNKVLKLLAAKQIELAFEQSQKEVDDLRKRTAQGMAAKGAAEKISKARTGKTFTTINDYELRIAILKELKEYGGALNHTQFAKQHDISRMTLYRWLEGIRLDMTCSSYTPQQQIAYYRRKIKEKQENK